MIVEWIAAVLIIAGAFLMMIAALGIVRFRDVYLRLHAATKAPSLASLLLIAGIVLQFFSLPVLIKGLLIVLFIFITAPISSHMISRVGHLMHVRQDERTHRDELPEQDDDGQNIGPS